MNERDCLTLTSYPKRPSTQFPARLVIPTRSVHSRIFRVLQSVVGEFGFKFPEFPMALRSKVLLKPLHYQCSFVLVFSLRFFWGIAAVA